MKNLRWRGRRDEEEKGLLVFWLREEMVRQERENDLEVEGWGKLQWEEEKREMGEER